MMNGDEVFDLIGTADPLHDIPMEVPPNSYLEEVLMMSNLTVEGEYELDGEVVGSRAMKGGAHWTRRLGAAAAAVAVLSIGGALLISGNSSKSIVAVPSAGAQMLLDASAQVSGDTSAPLPEAWTGFPVDGTAAEIMGWFDSHCVETPAPETTLPEQVRAGSPDSVSDHTVSPCGMEAVPLALYGDPRVKAATLRALSELSPPEPVPTNCSQAPDSPRWFINVSRGQYQVNILLDESRTIRSAGVTQSSESADGGAATVSCTADGLTVSFGGRSSLQIGFLSPPSGP